MKRSLMLAVIIALIAIPLASRANVEGSSLDQSYEQSAGAFGFLITNNPKMIQTFKPTQNTIVSIDVDLKNRKAGSNITFNLVDASDNVVSGPYSHQLSGPDGIDAWETFSFDSPYITVTAGTTYGIKISINDVQTRWWYNDIAGYANGYFKATSGSDWDALFRVYSKDTVSPLPATSSAASSTPSSLASSNNTAEVSSSIKPPVLTTLFKNDKKIDFTTSTLVDISNDDFVTLSGTADKDVKVQINIGDKSFTVNADKDGNWTQKITYAELKSGKYDVTGQVVKNSKSSEKSNLFKINVVAKTTSIFTNPSLPFWKDSTTLIIAFSTILLVIIAIIFYLLSKKKSKNIQEFNNPQIKNKSKENNGKFWTKK